MKKIGMLVVHDQVWGRVTANRSAGKTTWYYMDEFHLPSPGGPDSGVFGGNLEAVPEMGRHSHRYHSEY